MVQRAVSVDLERGARNYRPSADLVPAVLSPPTSLANPLVAPWATARQCRGYILLDVVHQA
jgi:hypothetical protein